MNDPFAVYTLLNWVAVFFYILATIGNTWGIVFRRERAERVGYRLMEVGLFFHTAALLYWWRVTGHGPYLARNEVLSADAWIALTVFLIFVRLYPKIRIASLLIFPSVFLLIALGVFFSPHITTLPPTFKSVWLAFHITFYKIALGTVIIACAFSIFYILKKRKTFPWLDRLPDLDVIDLYAYRFAGFAFIFWAIAMLAGSIWAYQSWGRFWGWDPVESWSLLTWILFGIYLHLRRFYRWSGEKAAWLYLLCLVFSLIAIFYTAHLSTSIHAEYFR